MTLQFSQLCWNEGDQCWSAQVHFSDRQLVVLIGFDRNSPTDSEKDSAVDRATDLFKLLTPEWELNCRRKAAVEITEAAYSQSEYDVTAQNVDELFDDMALESLEFTFCPDDDNIMGILGYRAAKIFPEMSVQINFLEDLSIDEVMVTE